MNELTDLQVKIARQHELLEYFAPVYMQAEVAALWMDICALMGVEAEAVALAASRESQSDMFAQLWIRPV
jgi:hypothetical protein